MAKQLKKGWMKRLLSLLTEEERARFYRAANRLKKKYPEPWASDYFNAAVTYEYLCALDRHVRASDKVRAAK